MSAAWALARGLAWRAAALMVAVVAALRLGGLAGEPVVVAALLAVGGVMITAITTLTLSRRQEELKEAEEARLRAERLRRTTAALRAELGFNLSTLRQSFDPRYNAARLANYAAAIDAAAAPDSGMPLGVATEAAVLFDLNKPNLADLPDVVAAALVAHHQLDRALSQIIAAINAARFDAASAERRKRVLLYYHLVGEAALKAALEARAVLDAHVAGDATPSTAEALEKRLSDDEAQLYDLLNDAEARADAVARALGVAPPAGSDEREDRS